LKHGANTEAESKFDKTPIDISDDNGRPDLKDILLVSNLCKERPISYWIISKLYRLNTHMILEKPGIFYKKKVVLALIIFLKGFIRLKFSD